jgi:penicillin-binding protein 2
MNMTGRGAPETGKNGTRGKKTLPQWERYLLLAIGIIVMSVVFIARLAELQLVHGAQYREETVSRISTTGTIHAARGNIYDRNGVPIAGSRMGFCVSYVDVKMPNGEKNAMLLALWQLLDRYGLAPETQLDRYVDWEHRLLMVRDDEAREALIKMILVSEEDRDNLLTGDQILNYMRDKTFEIGVAPDPETGGVTRLATYTDEEIRILMRLRFEILRNQPGLNNPMVLAEDVGKELMSEIEDRSDLFRGVSTYVKPYRVYYNARTASHILGYVGMATDREVRNFNGAIVERALGLEPAPWPAIGPRCRRTARRCR